MVGVIISPGSGYGFVFFCLVFQLRRHGLIILRKGNLLPPISRHPLTGGHGGDEVSGGDGAHVEGAELGVLRDVPAVVARLEAHEGADGNDAHVVLDVGLHALHHPRRNPGSRL